MCWRAKSSILITRRIYHHTTKSIGNVPMFSLSALVNILYFANMCCHKCLNRILLPLFWWTVDMFCQAGQISHSNWRYYTTRTKRNATSHQFLLELIPYETVKSKNSKIKCRIFVNENLSRFVCHSRQCQIFP